MKDSSSIPERPAAARRLRAVAVEDSPAAQRAVCADMSAVIRNEPPVEPRAERRLVAGFRTTGDAKPAANRSSALPIDFHTGLTPTPEPMKRTAIRIVAVDDNSIFLDLLIEMLTRYAELQVVGRALSGRQAIELAGSRQPDLVITDLQMPGLNGLEVCTRLKRLNAPPKVIVISLHQGEAFRQAAQEAGADAFLSKSDLNDDLVPAILKLVPLD